MDFQKEVLTAFDPHSPEYRRKLWVRVVTPDYVYHHVFWGRIAVVAAILAVAGWLALSAAAWAFVKYSRGYGGVSYLDLALYPVRRDEYRAKLGRYFIETGRARLEQQQFREGYALLLAGLGRTPQDVEARKLVAVIEAKIGRVDRALKTLAGGVAYAREDLDYLKLLFGFMLEAQEDERLIELARELLPPRPDEIRVNQFIALQMATAHYHRGRTAQVRQIIADWRLHRALEGQILLARCDWQSGLRAIAVARLERLLPEFGRRDELHLELVRMNRELGRYDEARRHALLRQFNDPAGAGPRIDLLHAYRASGDQAAEQREKEDYLVRFGRDEKSLLLLAWYALDTVQPELADRIAARVAENGFPPAMFDLARVATALVAKDHARALDLADAAIKTDQAVGGRNVTLLNGLRAVALFGLGDPLRGQAPLNAFLEEPRVRASDALLLSRQFKAIDRIPQARRVLERACQLDPLNQPALAELVKLDSEVGNRAALAENLPRLLAMRKHSRDALEAALKNLTEPSDEPLREQIRAELSRPVQ